MATHLWLGHFEGDSGDLVTEGYWQLVGQHHHIANLLHNDATQQIGESWHIHKVDHSHQIEVNIRIVEEEDLQTAYQRHGAYQGLHHNTHPAVNLEVLDAALHAAQVEIDVAIAGIEQIQVHYNLVAVHVLIVDLDAADAWWNRAQYNSIEAEAIHLVLRQSQSDIWLNCLLDQGASKVIGIGPNLLQNLWEEG